MAKMKITIKFGDIFIHKNNGKPLCEGKFTIKEFDIVDGVVCMIWSEEGYWLSPSELQEDYYNADS
jgi:hypothetical protein